MAPNSAVARPEAASSAGAGAGLGEAHDADDADALRYRGEALAAAWGAAGTDAVDFGPAWSHLSRRPDLVNARDARGRTVLHCCSVLPEDSTRHVLVNNLLALGADPDAEDEDGWSPSQSRFVADAARRWRTWAPRFARQDEGGGGLTFLLERGTDGPIDLRRVQQALWLCAGRHNADSELTVHLEGAANAQRTSPLHLAAMCIPPPPGAQDEGEEGEEGRSIPEPLHVRDPEVREGGWGARRALLGHREAASSSSSSSSSSSPSALSPEPWTPAHELLCLLLDLGADATRVDGSGRRADDPAVCASPTVRALLRSDWEDGEATSRGLALTDEGKKAACVCVFIPPLLLTPRKKREGRGERGEGRGEAKGKATRLRTHTHAHVHTRVVLRACVVSFIPCPPCLRVRSIECTHTLTCRNKHIYTDENADPPTSFSIPLLLFLFLSLSLSLSFSFSFSLSLCLIYRGHCGCAGLCVAIPLHDGGPRTHGRGGRRRGEGRGRRERRERRQGGSVVQDGGRRRRGWG